MTTDPRPRIVISPEKPTITQADNMTSVKVEMVIALSIFEILFDYNIPANPAYSQTLPGIMDAS
jgi:hypothetical protein